MDKATISRYSDAPTTLLSVCDSPRYSAALRGPRRPELAFQTQEGAPEDPGGRPKTRELH